jgi:hypothetical protein
MIKERQMERQDEEFNELLAILIAFLAIAVIVGIVTTIWEGGCTGAVVLTLSVLAWVPLGNVRMG